jgi:hypothetical protein
MYSASMVEVLACAGLAAAMLVAWWAADVRAGVHRQWARMRRRLDREESRVVDWCVAMGTVVGSV